MLLEPRLVLQVLLSVNVLLDFLLTDRVVKALSLYLDAVLHLATLVVRLMCARLVRAANR